MKLAVIEFIFWGISGGAILALLLTIVDTIYYIITGKRKIDPEP